MSVHNQVPGKRWGRRPVYWLRALGRRDLPGMIVVGDRAYRREKTIKHDFFAATGLYMDEAGERVVLKMGRTEDLAGCSLLWLGRWLRRRETRFYTRLADLPNVPALLGTVGRTGFVHRYVPGRPLEKGKAVPVGFFRNLEDLLKELHRRRMAYVDTNKPQNILIGEDGLPHLIDFQISHDLHEWGDMFLNRWLLGRLQEADLYHVLKHKRRICPQEMTQEELEASQQRSWLIRAHRFISRPYFLLRRRTFSRMKKAGRLLPTGSE